MMLESFLPRPDFPFLFLSLIFLQCLQLCLLISQGALSQFSSFFTLQLKCPSPQRQDDAHPALPLPLSHWTCIDTHSLAYGRFLNLIIVSFSNLLFPFVKAEATVPVDY